MDTWYRVRGLKFYHTVRFEPVKVSRETDKFLVINGRRVAKRSDDERFFDSIAEAYVFMRGMVSDKINRARKELAILEKKMEELKEIDI